MAKQNPTTTQTNSQENTPGVPKKDDFQAQILERLAKLEKENQELKENGTINTNTKSKEKYA